MNMHQSSQGENHYDIDDRQSSSPRSTRGRDAGMAVACCSDRRHICQARCRCQSRAGIYGFAMLNGITSTPSTELDDNAGNRLPSVDKHSVTTAPVGAPWQSRCVRSSTPTLLASEDEVRVRVVRTGVMRDRDVPPAPCLGEIAIPEQADVEPS